MIPTSTDDTPNPSPRSSETDGADGTNSEWERTATRRGILAGIGGAPVTSGILRESSPRVGAAKTGIEWSHYHGDVRRTGRSALGDPSEPTRTRWQLEAPRDGTGDRTRTAPVVAGRTVFTVNRDGNLLAVDLPSGTVEWSYTVSGAVQVAPAVTDDGVFLGTSEGKIVSLDRANGEERWSIGVDTGVSTPAVRDGRVYLGQSGSETAEVLAFDAVSGDSLWRTTVPKTGSVFRPTEITLPTPAVAGETVVVNIQNLKGSGTSGLVALNAEDGTKRWETPLRTVCYPPSVTENACYAIAGDVLHRVSLAGGTVRWEKTFEPHRPGADTRVVPDVVTSGPGTVYVQVPTGIGRSGFVALDKRTGQERWRYTVGSGSAVGSGISTTESRAYFAIGGTLVAANPESGFEEWTYQLEDEPPEGRVESRRMGSAPVVTPNGVLVKHLGRIYVVDDGTAPGTEGSTPRTSTGADETATRTESTRTEPPGDTRLDGGSGPQERGFFTNDESGGLPSFSGSDWTVLSTLITVVATVITVVDMLRGGDS